MPKEESKDVLASPARHKIYDIIRAEPGISVGQLARRAGMYWTSAAMHVARLAQAGLVSSVRGGRRRALFAIQIPSATSPGAPALLAEPACRRVAVTIVQTPGLRVWELCEVTGMSERAVYHHVKRLVDAGLVVSKKHGAYRGLAPTPTLYALLASGEEGTGEP